ncbi:hypothetical protein Hanom_Chr14g01335271 [Helianthus anomalus]
MVKSYQLDPHKSKMTKVPSCEVYLVRFNHKKITEIGLKDITCKGLQTSSTFSVIIKDKRYSLQYISDIHTGRFL